MASLVSKVADTVARKIGEGYAKPDGDSSLPLDVNYAKVAEWLVDRKQVPSDWNRKLLAIQAKAAAAAAALPPGFLAALPGPDAPLDYFRCRAVMARLVEEGAERGMLGSLKGAAGDWEKVVKAYEYHLIQLAEAGHTMASATDFVIPHLKRQAARSQQQMGDLEKRAADAHRSAAAAAAEFRKECAALGIDSDDIRGGLLGQTARLPELVEGALCVLRAPAVQEAVQYYAAFAGMAGTEGGATVEAAGILPVLEEVRLGSTAVMSPQELAAAAAAGPSAAPAATPAGGGGGIDWGDAGAGSSAAAADSGAAAAGGGGISWDLDPADLAAEAAPAPVEIAWDIGAGDFAADGGGGGGGGIDWDIGIDAASGGHGASPGECSADAFGEQAPAVQRLVWDGEYRGRLLDDIHELIAFLTQRCVELGGKGSELSLAATPEGARGVTADDAARMRNAVSAASGALGGDELKRLLALRTSGRYLDRAARELEKRSGQEAKCIKTARELEARRVEVQRSLMADSAALAAAVGQARQAKEEVERVLGARLGQRINIQGEINNLI